MNLKKIMMLLSVLIEGAASYWESGRKIALKVESGGVLHTDARTVSAISLGDVVSGYGMMMIEGGTVSNEYITVGRCGIGILHQGTEYTTSVHLQS